MSINSSELSSITSSSTNFVNLPSNPKATVGLFTSSLTGKKRKFSEIDDLTQENNKVTSQESNKIFYVLKCYKQLDNYNDVKYYIGETKNLPDLLLGKIRPAFSQNFRRCSVVKVINSNKVSNGRSLVLYYMLRFGVDNVRGGGHRSEIISNTSTRIFNYILSKLNLSMSFDEVEEKVQKITELLFDVYFTSKKFNLDYHGIMNNNFESILDNPNFNLLNNTRYLTRSLKRKVLPDVKFTNKY